MKQILNITNGDSAVEIMKKADIPGKFLPWQDVLHDGPIPDGLSLEKLSSVRADFIISRGWGSPEAVKSSFIERDNVLKSFREYDKVILWFEHDLYDQLQLLQILDWFNETGEEDIKLSLICTDKYLGMLSPEQMKGLHVYEEPVKREHLLLASNAWSAFRSSSPEKWSGLRNTDTRLLPFLEGTIVRLLEEYPNISNGLSRTSNQALKIISEGEVNPIKVFKRIQESEERMYLGDESFWIILQTMLDSNPALLELSTGNKLTSTNAKDQELGITSAGMNVLSGERNWLDINKKDSWFGGVHLNSTNIWCWDSHTGTILKKG